MTGGLIEADTESPLFFKVPDLPSRNLPEPAIERDTANREAAQFSAGLSPEQMKADAERNEYARSENFKNHFELITIIALWSVVIIIGVMFVIFILHLVCPENWHWLTKNQVEHLQSILLGSVGGIASTIAARHLKKRLE